MHGRMAYLPQYPHDSWRLKLARPCLGAKLLPALKSSKPEDSSAEAQAAPAADEDEQQRIKKKKKVHFQMDRPWVPPHRRSSDWGDRPR